MFSRRADSSSKSGFAAWYRQYVFRLSALKKDQLQRLNAAIEAGTLTNREGKQPTQPLTEALVTDDGKRVYPVVDGIPVLLEGESIAMEQVA